MHSFTGISMESQFLQSSGFVGTWLHTYLPGGTQLLKSPLSSSRLSAIFLWLFLVLPSTGPLLESAKCWGVCTCSFWTSPSLALHSRTPTHFPAALKAEKSTLWFLSRRAIHCSFLLELFLSPSSHPTPYVIVRRVSSLWIGLPEWGTPPGWSLFFQGSYLL